MPLQGNMAKLGKLKRNLEELARVPSRVAPIAVAKLNDRMRNQFLTATDPYGSALARNASATIAKKGFDHPMTETGTSASVTVFVPMSGAGIAIRTTQEVYWNMNPGPNRPERPMLPKRGLPPLWKQDLKDAAIEACRRAVK